MYLNLYGVNLVFDREGRGEAVVLLAEEAGVWAGDRPFPPGHAYYLLDLPGFGRTEAPKMSPEELAEFVVAFLAVMHLTQAPILARGVGLDLAPLLRERGYRVEEALPGLANLREIR